MFLFDERERLLRQENWTAPALSQELYCMFGPDVPNVTNSPVVVDLPKDSTAAPFQINNNPSGATPIFDLKNPNGSDGGTITFGGGTFNFTQGGQTTPVGGGGGGSGGVPVWG